MSESLVINSHRGPYEVQFLDDALAWLGNQAPQRSHFVIDKELATLYQKDLISFLRKPSTLLIEAAESSKSLDRIAHYVDHLLQVGIKRDHVLIAVGGGTIQDITCFIASILLRGIDWWFVPTTLLAQADSCIGSKNSINVGTTKNAVGTFWPPRRILLSLRFLTTLTEVEIRSGIGEILKAHAIAGQSEFTQVTSHYEELLKSGPMLSRYVRQSLEIKKSFVEQDEFDVGIRNIFNYGHTFGHAIESATNFAVPHGIAVSMGMDLANFVASQMDHRSQQLYEERHAILSSNYQGFEDYPIREEALLAALTRDKKNTGEGYVTLILPTADGRLERRRHPLDERLGQTCRQFLVEIRAG